MLRRFMALSMAGTMLSAPLPAAAQSEAEVIYMRRPLPLQPTGGEVGYRWDTTSSFVDSNGNPVDQANFCGDVTKINTSVCLNTETNEQVGDSFCGAKPAERSTEFVGTSCSFSWYQGPWNDPGASCSASEIQSRTVQCRNQSGQVVADSYCDGARPAMTQTVSDYSGCSGSNSNISVAWGAWTASSTCSATATRSRTGACRVDGAPAPDSVCTSNGFALSETQPAPNYSSCTYSWKTSQFADPGASCTASETQIRSVTCERDVDSAVVDDTYCSRTQTKPVATQVAADYSGCTYNPTYGPWGTCTNGTQSQSMTGCTRSDGTAVATSACSSSPATNSQSCTPESTEQCSSWQGARVYRVQNPVQSSFDDAKTTGEICADYNSTSCSGDADAGSYIEVNGMNHGYAEFQVVYNGAVRYLNSGFINNSRAVSSNKCISPDGSRTYNGANIGPCAQIGGVTSSTVSMTLGDTTYTMTTQWSGSRTVVATVSTSGGSAGSQCTAAQSSRVEKSCVDTGFGQICNDKKYAGDTAMCAGYMNSSNFCQ